MNNDKLPSPDMLRKLLRYDPATGDLNWQPRERADFSSDRSYTMWKARHFASPALASVDGKGYRRGVISGVAILAHRAIWAIMTGEWPDQFIDHINGERADNRWENLRHTDRAGNARNSRKPRTNTSGTVGVRFHKGAQKWHAQITVDRRAIHLGTFETHDAAFAARQDANTRHGFSARHGL